MKKRPVVYYQESPKIRESHAQEDRIPSDAVFPIIGAAKDQAIQAAIQNLTFSKAVQYANQLGSNISSVHITEQAWNPILDWRISNAYNITFANGTTITHIMGEESVDTTTATSVSASELGIIVKWKYDPRHRKVYAVDTLNHRVLRFSLDQAFRFNGKAEFVFGQWDLESNSAGSGMSGFNTPTDCCIDPNGTLWIVSRTHHRVLGFYNASTRTNQDENEADVVLGQASFYQYSANRGGSASELTLNTPTSIACDTTGRLFVSDTGNNRILWYNSPGPMSSAANGVLGQVDFTSVSSNRGGSIALNTLNNVRYIEVVANGSNHSLYAYDVGNGRILRYDSLDTITNGAAATRVFLQSSGTATPSYGTGNAQIGNPSLILSQINLGMLTVSQNNTLAATDLFNGRTLIWNSANSIATDGSTSNQQISFAQGAGSTAGYVGNALYASHTGRTCVFDQLTSSITLSNLTMRARRYESYQIQVRNTTAGSLNVVVPSSFIIDGGITCRVWYIDTSRTISVSANRNRTIYLTKVGNDIYMDASPEQQN